MSDLSLPDVWKGAAPSVVPLPAVVSCVCVSVITRLFSWIVGLHVMELETLYPNCESVTRGIWRRVSVSPAGT